MQTEQNADIVNRGSSIEKVMKTVKAFLATNLNFEFLSFIEDVSACESVYQQSKKSKLNIWHLE